MTYIHVTHNDERKMFRILNDLSLGDTIEYILQKLGLYIYSFEKIVINGNIDISDHDMNKPIIYIAQTLRIVLYDRLRDISGNIENKDNKMIDNYMKYIQMRNDNCIADSYQKHLNRFDRYFNRNYTVGRRPVRYDNLMSSVNNLNGIYSNLNNTSPNVNQNTNVDVSGNLQRETNTYNTIYNNIMNSLNQPTETFEMEFRVTPLYQNNIDVSGTDLSGNYYSSVLNGFSNMINNNNRNGAIHYQPIPLNSYSNIFTNLLNRLGLNSTRLNEDVKIILTDEEIANLKRIKYKDISGAEGTESKCTVCLDEFKDDDDMIQLKCDHYFHEECIKRWFKECSNKCPICREEVAKGVPNIPTGGVNSPQAP